MPKVAAVEVGLLRMHKAEVVEVGRPRTRRVAAGEVVKAAAPACGAKAEVADLRFSRAWVVAKVLLSSVAAARVVMSSVEDPTSAAARMCVCARALTCVSGGGAIAGAIATVITDHVLACTSRAGRGWCHRHHWKWRVLRHCHPYSYRWHRHGRWR